mgnify:CR=1 FL=1|tara:strand:- start:64 stop:264 length:201 start_codon:yes stop_codon:yes gene_type:complete
MILNNGIPMKSNMSKKAPKPATTNKKKKKKVKKEETNKSNPLANREKVGRKSKAKMPKAKGKASKY